MSFTPIIERIENVVPQYRDPNGDWFLFWTRPIVDRRPGPDNFDFWYSYIVLPNREA